MLNSKSRLRALSTDLEPGALVSRDFEIVELAGRGSFSTVYKAHQLSRGRGLIALKILHRGIQRQLEKNAGGPIRNPYLKEQLLCERLLDTAVCPVLAVGETLEGRFYVALEWAPGVTLEEHMRQNRSGLHGRQAVDIIVALGRTLQAMHGAGVIHRDLKPDNIMVDVRPDKHLTVSVLDFGIAKLVDEVDGSDVDSMLVGTPAWMSPEQAAGDPTDPRSDIFSMAAITYLLLTGARHIQLSGLGSNSEDYISYLLGDRALPTRPASGMNPAVPRQVDKLLAWGLHRDPARRPQAVGNLMEELVPVLHTHEPPELRPGLLARAKKLLIR
ncbi:MAG: serine/threonine protein kinase [Myxococcota bacterium]|jgi:serine/threonine protein kinase